jgi:hypothetical protein
MNEQVSWIFYRYAIGVGTLLLGFAAIWCSIMLWRIAKSLEYSNAYFSVVVQDIPIKETTEDRVCL